jgi:purine-nucleoside phosphorylase
MATPHIKAENGDFAKTVLMPGDPLRSKFIADNFLTDAKLINNVRGVQGYTGLYNGKRISVMASGMGMPSMAIYAHELFDSYGVETIIRVGSAGGIAENINLKDIVLAQAACTDSNFIKSFKMPGSYSPIGDFELLKKAQSVAQQKGMTVYVGNILSSDVFYSSDIAIWQKMNVLAVEMECAALYSIAASFSKKALCICTISDCPLKGQELNSQERQTGFGQMIELALEIAE